MGSTNQKLDWSGIRAAAIALGSVNAAATQAGQGLPPDEAERLRQRINKRALRQRWLDAAKELQIMPSNGAKPLSQNVQTGSEIVQNSLETRRTNTRTKLAQYAEEAAEEALNSTHKLKVARSVKDLAGIYSTIWPEKDTPGVAINVWGSQVVIDL